MSADTDTSDDERTARDRIADRRDRLEDLAESDRDTAWVYRTVRQSLFEGDAGDSS